jgi:hypothetical protein
MALSKRRPDCEVKVRWTNGGLKSGAVFLQKVANHLTPAQRAKIEKRAANFHPDPFQLFHDMMEKGIGAAKLEIKDQGDKPLARRLRPSNSA